MTRANTERDTAIIADYLGGLSRPQVAERHGVSEGTVSWILTRNRVKLPDEVRSRRFAERNARIGRARTVWPDCPPRLAPLYRKLKRCGVPAREARRQIEQMEGLA